MGEGNIIIFVGFEIDFRNVWLDYIDCKVLGIYVGTNFSTWNCY